MTTPLPAWSLVQPLWVIEMDHPEADETTLLQADIHGGTFVLAFTSGAQAESAIDQLGVRQRARSFCYPGDVPEDLMTALCQVRADGLIVDYDPATRRCAWSRRCTAAA